MTYEETFAAYEAARDKVIKLGMAQDEAVMVCSSLFDTARDYKKAGVTSLAESYLELALKMCDQVNANKDHAAYLAAMIDTKGAA